MYAYLSEQFLELGLDDLGLVRKSRLKIRQNGSEYVVLINYIIYNVFVYNHIREKVTRTSIHRDTKHIIRYHY